MLELPAAVWFLVASEFSAFPDSHGAMANYGSDDDWMSD
jgi:hypothetical protein